MDSLALAIKALADIMMTAKNSFVVPECELRRVLQEIGNTAGQALEQLTSTSQRYKPNK